MNTSPISIGIVLTKLFSLAQFRKKIHTRCLSLFRPAVHWRLIWGKHSWLRLVYKAEGFEDNPAMPTGLQRWALQAMWLGAVSQVFYVLICSFSWLTLVGWRELLWTRINGSSAHVGLQLSPLNWSWWAYWQSCKIVRDWMWVVGKS